MILERLDRQAEEARQRYENLTRIWVGLYGRAVAHPNFATGGSAPQLVQDAYAAAQSYLEGEKDLIIKAIDEIASDAHQAVRAKIASIDASELTDDALTHLTQTQNYLSDEIIAQIHRDVALMRRTLQTTALNVSIQSRGRRIPFRTALIEHRIAHPDEPNFFFVDRRFRRTPAKSFIGSIWRWSLLSAHNETTLLTLVDHGIDRAGIMRLESGVEIQAEILSITGKDDLPAYDDIRSTYFHPNARSWLAVERADV